MDKPIFPQEGDDNPDREHSEALLPEQEIVDINDCMLELDLPEVLADYSTGFDAGVETIDAKNYACSYAQGVIDASTGEIRYFAIFKPTTPTEITANQTFLELRVAYDTSFGHFRIIEVATGSELTPQAVANLYEAIEKWNTIKQREHFGEPESE